MIKKFLRALRVNSLCAEEKRARLLYRLNFMRMQDEIDSSSAILKQSLKGD